MFINGQFEVSKIAWTWSIELKIIFVKFIKLFLDLIPYNNYILVWFLD